MKKILILAIAFSVSAALFAADEVTGTVKAQNLNVRVKPGTACSVIASLKKGAQVTVVGRKDKWLKIKVPKESTVWISTSCLKDDTVIKETALKAGPGAAFNDFGTLPAGAKIKALEEKREGWIRIEPPEGLTAWTAADYVDLPPNTMLKTEKDDASAEQKKTTEAAETPKTAQGNNAQDNSRKEQKKPVDPLPFAGPAKDVTFTGVIVGIGGAVYVTHAIAVQKKEEYVPASYLHSSKKKLKDFENKLVKIRGIQRKVKGWKLPMMEVESVTVVE